MSPQEQAALERLIKIAQGDTGQSRRVADFLLAWWNAGDCGSFDLTNLSRVHSYPDALGYEAPLRRIVEEWRPELVAPR